MATTWGQLGGTPWGSLNQWADPMAPPTVNPNWPLMSCQVAFNSGFNTPGSPLWSDLTPRMWSLSCDRGRQYELDQTQAGQGSLVFADRDEILNPANPYSPYVLGNLLVNAGYDPTFESYPVGSTPSWVTGIGVTPIIGTASPHSGTQRIGWTTTVSGTPQGMSFPIPTTVGVQYTVSAWVIKVGADNFAISVSGGPTGTVLNTSGSYARLSVTFTATLTSHTVVLQTVAGPTGANNYRADDLQLDYGPTVQPTTSVPWSTQVLPYRQVCVQAQWPPVPLGGAVNLLNLTGQNNVYDMSFESYPVGVRPGWVLSFGAANPVVTTTNPQQGTQCLTWNVTNGGGGQGLALNFACIPGQTYTASVYMRQTVANQQDLFVNGHAPMVSSTTVGAYVRLVGTFTADQPTLQLCLSTSAPTLSGVVNVDAIQLEVGSSASPFSPTGPVIYGVHRGYVERWPAVWNFEGMYGRAEVTTVDGFAALAARKLHTEYRNAVMTKGPDYHWTLGEPQNAPAFADSSGNNGPSLMPFSSPFGPSNPPFASGVATAIPGDPSGLGVQFTGDPTNVGVNQVGTILTAGQQQTIGIKPVPAAASTPWAASFACWFRQSGPFPGGTSEDVVALFDPVPNANAPLYIAIFGNGAIAARIQVASPPPTGTFQASISASPSLAVLDGKWHHLVGTSSQDNTNTIVNLYVDGVLRATNTYATGTTAGFINSTARIIAVGGAFNQTQFGATATCQVTQLSMWYRVLAAAEVTDLWNAGQGYVNEGSGARIARYLAASGYSGITAIDTGQSTMAISNLADNTILLDTCQAVALSENGNLWVDGTGTLTFFSRTRRYLATTSMWTFGENELPYESDIAYDYDPTLVYNDVQVTRAGGVVAESQDAASQANYGPRNYQRTININSDNETFDAANYILATHKDPHQRISTLTIKPSANPALWPVALGAEIGDRVTVKRRTTAGFTMSGDFFVEQISHAQAPDSWTVQFQMSPADPTNVWILGDPVYGVLGTTTRLAY